MPINETSITVADRAVPRFTQDPQTRSWVLSGQRPLRPSRLEILRYTQREVANLRRLPRDWDGSGGAPLRGYLANVAISFIAALVTEDGLATPQFSPLPDGGLYVVWLVGGDRLTMSLDHEEISLHGTWADGQDAFRFEQRWGAFLPSELEVALNDATSFLEKISGRVQHQLMVL
jgi:hypothetical protein